MTFEEVLTQAIAMLQRLGRVSYRALKRQFDVDDDYLEDLKEAVLYAYPQVVDDGQGETRGASRWRTCSRSIETTTRVARPGRTHSTAA